MAIRTRHRETRPWAISHGTGRFSPASGQKAGGHYPCPPPRGLRSGESTPGVRSTSPAGYPKQAQGDQPCIRSKGQTYGRLAKPTVHKPRAHIGNPNLGRTPATTQGNRKQQPPLLCRKQQPPQLCQQDRKIAATAVANQNHRTSNSSHHSCANQTTKPPPT